MSTKANVLLVGSGGVGSMTAYNLEVGGLASVTSILRSNYEAVTQNGFTITSLDHGFVRGWKPSTICNSVPTAAKENPEPFDYVIVTTKNIADVPPTVAEIIAPAVTQAHTAILLLQNGLNIEKPLLASFPSNPILSGVSLIGATETSPGVILHDDRDRLIIGAFINPNIPLDSSTSAAKRFVELYSASGKVTCTYDENVGFVRWRKLVYNASYNSACAISHMDTARMRTLKYPIDDVVRPLMVEIVAIANAAGHGLLEDIVERMIHADPEDTYFKPSMQQDIEKGNFMEFENIVGEPLREAEKLGVPAPNLRMVYGLLRILQTNIKEAKGLLSFPKGPDLMRPILGMVHGSAIPT